MVSDEQAGHLDGPARIYDSRHACAMGKLKPTMYMLRRTSAELVDWHSRKADTTEEPRFARVAQEIAGTPVRAYCWTNDDWGPLAEERQLIDRNEFWVVGFADPFAGELASLEQDIAYPNLPH